VEVIEKEANRRRRKKEVSRRIGQGWRTGDVAQWLSVCLA
jgi:hypothetical protein